MHTRLSSVEQKILGAHCGHARPSLPTQAPSDARTNLRAVRIANLLARRYPNRQSSGNGYGRLFA